MRKILNPWLHVKGYNCFGCCPDNPFGLKMTFYEDGDDIVSFWKPSEYYQSWVDTLHGGMISTLIDELCGWVVFRKLQTTGVTGKLEVRYLKEIHTSESSITVRGHLVEVRHGIAVIEATITNSRGVLCARGRTTYSVFPKEVAKEKVGFSGCDADSEQLML